MRYIRLKYFKFSEQYLLSHIPIYPRATATMALWIPPELIGKIDAEYCSQIVSAKFMGLSGADLPVVSYN